MKRSDFIMLGAAALYGCSEGKSPYRCYNNPYASEDEDLPVIRVWGVGQSLMLGTAQTNLPPQCPLAEVPMWLRTSTYQSSVFEVLGAIPNPAPPPPTLVHGAELQCGVDLFIANRRNVQTRICRGSTFLAAWVPPGPFYTWVTEDVPKVMAASKARFPGAKFDDHIVINGGQSEAVSDFETFALQIRQNIIDIRAEIEGLLGNPAVLHIEMTQLGLINQKWITTVRSQEASVPNANLIYYDSIPTADGTHPTPVGYNTLGSLRALNILSHQGPAH